MIFNRFNRICSSNYRTQVLAAITTNLITLSHGLALGWLSPAIIVLQSKNLCPLISGPLTAEQLSWVGSIICIGSIIGNILFGCLVDKVGRKITLIIIGVPNVCFWLTIIFGNHVNHLLIGRLLAGVTGGGIFITIPIYIAEIADPRIRGSLGSLLILLLNFGILLGYVIGSNISYKITPILTIWIPLFHIALIMYFPDTPQYWIKFKKNDLNAKRSLKFYQNYRGKTIQECQKFNEYYEKLKENILQKNESQTTNCDGIRYKIKLFSSFKTWKGILIGVALMGINMFSGTFAITNYSSRIFEKSETKLSPNLNTIIIGVIQIFGTCVALVLCDKYGRKPLLLISSIGIVIGMTTMGIYTYYQQTTVITISVLHWIPITSLSFVIFIASIGVIPLPIVILSEILPNEVRSIGSTICMFALSTMAFIVLKIFPILMVILHLYGTILLCSSTTIVGVIFIATFVPETKGKNLNNNNDKNTNTLSMSVESTYF